MTERLTSALQRIENALHQCGHPDYSLNEMVRTISDSVKEARSALAQSALRETGRDYCESCGYTDSHDPNCPRPKEASAAPADGLPEEPKLIQAWRAGDDPYFKSEGPASALAYIDLLRSRLEAANREIAWRKEATDIVLRSRDQWHNRALAAEAALGEVRTELETERMRLAGCGVAADQNTRSSAKLHRLPDDSPYRSGSYDAVCAAVDREMAFREEVERYREKANALHRLMSSEEGGKC